MDGDLDLTRRCLTLISRIAGRAAGSPHPDHAADALMELRGALLEPRPEAGTPSVTGGPDRTLDRLHQTLDFIDSTSQEFTARHVLNYALRSTWN